MWIVKSELGKIMGAFDSYYVASASIRFSYHQRKDLKFLTEEHNEDFIIKIRDAKDDLIAAYWVEHHEIQTEVTHL